jgi:hypothetical protein
MNILEKKALAFEKLAALQNEEVIDEILAYLIKLNAEEKERVYNLSGRIESISERYGETLKKLAQEEVAGKTEKMEAVFDKAATQYGAVLQKLAE